MENWIIFGIVMLAIVSFMVYLFFMFFLPEWVGITGKVAKKAIESHGTNSEEVKTPLDN